MSELLEIYRAARPDVEDDAATAAALEAACERARSAWPDLTIDDAALCQALAGLGPDIASLPASAIEEVALCLACGRGERAAIEHLEKTYFEGARGALRAMKLEPAMREEVLQETRRKLLVGDPPKLVGYAGRGSPLT